VDRNFNQANTQISYEEVEVQLALILGVALTL